SRRRDIANVRSAPYLQETNSVAWTQRARLERTEYQTFVPRFQVAKHHDPRGARIRQIRRQREVAGETLSSGRRGQRGRQSALRSDDQCLRRLRPSWLHSEAAT